MRTETIGFKGALLRTRVDQDISVSCTDCEYIRGIRRRAIIICFPVLKQNRGVYRFKEYGDVGTVLSRLSVTQDIDWYRLGDSKAVPTV